MQLALKVTIPTRATSDPLPVFQATLVRGLNQPRRWICSSHEHSSLPAMLLEAEKRGQRATAQLIEIDSGEILGELRALTGITSDDKGFTIEGSELEPARANLPNPFAPRRRVHQPENLLQIVESLVHGVAFAPALQRELQSLASPPGIYVIQDHISDWQLLETALAEYRRLQPQEELRDLVVTGDSAGGWFVTFGSRVALIESHGQGHEIDHGRVSSVKTDHVPALGEFPVFSVTETSRAEFSPKEWREHWKRNLPFYYRDEEPGESIAIVTAAADRLFQGASSGIGWERQLRWTNGRAKPWNAGSAPCHLWQALGVVSRFDEQNAWLEVELPDFDAEGYGNILRARLLPPSTGVDQKSGLHVAPAEKSQVQLSWSGRWGDPVVCPGNLRFQPATKAAPSVVFDTNLNVEAARLQVLSHSGFEIEIKGSDPACVHSHPPFQIEADQCCAVLGNGNLHIKEAI